MRLTCPNCAAQYEVDDDLIPSEGREVQCSNCGTTWYEGGPQPEAESEVAEVLPPPPPAAPEPERPTGPADPDLDVDEDDDDDYDEFDDDDEALDRAMTQAATPPRRLPPDQHVLDILRQERAHEDRVRASGPVPEDDAIPDEGDDTPPEPPRSFIRRPSPPLDAREQAARERARMAEAATRARARDALRPVRPGRAPEAEAPRASQTVIPAPYAPREEAASPAPAGRAARRELLPDIEEINSSLRPTEPDDTYDDDPFARYDARYGSPRRRGGFGLGFLLASAVVLACLGVYVFADGIAAAVPDLAAPLADYVAWVDRLRLAIVTGAESLTDRVLPEG